MKSATTSTIDEMTINVTNDRYYHTVVDISGYMSIMDMSQDSTASYLTLLHENVDEDCPERNPDKFILINKPGVKFTVYGDDETIIPDHVLVEFTPEGMLKILIVHHKETLSLSIESPGHVTVVNDKGKVNVSYNC